MWAKSKVSKELMERWQDRIQWVRTANFDSFATEDEKNKEIKKVRSDYGYFVQRCFPHLATKPTAKFQIEAANIIKETKNIKALFEWSRGHAKSSHVSLMIPLWLLIQETPEINFMVLVSKSQDMAIRLLSDLQAELQFNEILTGLFGKQVKEGSWETGEFVTTGGCMFLALGRGQSPRGLKNRAKRPDYIDIDDLDDDELVENPKRVKKLLEWVRSALFGALEGGRGRFVMVGNRIGKNSVLAEFAKSKGLHHTIVNILDKNGLPSWHENYTLAEVQSMREFITEIPFQKEYMNNPLTEGTIFQKKHFRYGKMLDLKQYKTLIAYTDPSWKGTDANDHKATMLVGQTPEGYFHLLKAFLAQTSVTQMVSWSYDIEAYVAGRVPVMHYMEANFMQDLLLEEYKKEGKLRGRQIPIRGDYRKKPDKFARIEGMQPTFERGMFIFNEDEKEDEHMVLLVDHMLMIEKGSKTPDDGPDALEGATWLLNHRNRTNENTYVVGKRESRKY